MADDFGVRGDFSRIRRSRGKGYTAVLQQQGRVALDADANEQQSLAAGLRRTEAVDVIGQFGGPVGDDGFYVDGSTGQIIIGAGRYYVDGLLCENPAAQLSYDSQPYLNVPAGTGAGLLAGLSGQQQLLQVYLQAWQRLVTVLDDPCLREPALGQADTTARLQTVWRVIARTAQVDVQEVAGPFCPALYQPAPGGTERGTLTVTTGGGSADCGCGPVAAAGYQGIENQLYRVEIHGGNDASVATFKWSRENGSVVCAVTGVAGSTVQVDSLGPDANLGFQPTEWVELTDDSYLFGDPPNRPGLLYQIQSIDKDTPSVLLNAPVTGINPGLNARMRRWDQAGPAASQAGVPLPVGPTVMELENGIQVSFGPGTYQPGDYWTFPARTATGTVEWPPCGSDGNSAQPPSSIVVHEAPLACLYWSGTAGGVVTEDCRRPFHPLTAPAPPPTPPAIHVTSVNWPNDDFVTLDELFVDGLTVTLDQVVNGPVNGGNFIVALELPGTPQGDQTLAAGSALVRAPALAADPAAAAEPGQTIYRSVEIADSPIVVSGQAVTWTLPPSFSVVYLQSFLLSTATAGQFTRVRVRLLGDMLFTTGAAGLIYLDGKALGKPGNRQDGTPCAELSLPSGAGVTSSNLESWFYLAPLLEISSFTVAYSSLTGVVSLIGLNHKVFLGVEPTNSPGTGYVTQSVAIGLAYPPVTPVTIDLTLASDGEAVVSVPASVTIPAWTASPQTVDVTISAAPETTSTYTITASLGNALNEPSTLSAEFTIVGPPIEKLPTVLE